MLNVFIATLIIFASGSQGDLTLIRHHFNLDEADTEYERDEHYQCGKCNSVYLD